MKICSKCQAAKEAASFGLNRASKDGLQAYCKDCRKVENGSDSRRAYMRDYYAANPEKFNKPRDTPRARRMAAWRDLRLQNPPTTGVGEGKSKYALQQRELLSDEYVARVLRMRVDEAPARLIEAKREHLRLVRLLKELK